MTNKERFKANIRMVEVEPHSFCNRKCWFCPNSKIDRTGPVKHINNEVYWRLLKDLASINYSEALCFAAWCEPFSYATELIKLVRQAKHLLPDALIMTNTNTDYLTCSVLEEAANAGLEVIKAQLYFDEDEEFCEDVVREKMRKLRHKLPDISFKEMSPLNWFALVNGSMVINAYAKDFRKVGHNRCDMNIRKIVPRLHTCYEPIQMFGLNHEGWITPCCNIRPDYEPHQKHLLGNLSTERYGIFDIYRGVLIPETEYPCSVCMGKQGHANHKLVFTQVIKDMKWRTRLVPHSLPQSGQEQLVPQTQF